ncbi:MAG TPA: hypothetical protein VFS75_00155 [Candidatus Paceibacterota bacterium]|nr:hypothetical protein [Candidatus Paceibacterota bacterium]
MDLQTLFTNLIAFTNATLIPFLLAIAFLVFIWNVVRYFIIGGADEGEHEHARSLATWGILAFVVILSLWGIVNLLVDGLGLADPTPVTPDYIGWQEAPGP